MPVHKFSVFGANLDMFLFCCLLKINKKDPILSKLNNKNKIKILKNSINFEL